MDTPKSEPDVKPSAAELGAPKVEPDPSPSTHISSSTLTEGVKPIKPPVRPNHSYDPSWAGQSASCPAVRVLTPSPTQPSSPSASDKGKARAPAAIDDLPEEERHIGRLEDGLDEEEQILLATIPKARIMGVDKYGGARTSECASQSERWGRGTGADFGVNIAVKKGMRIELKRVSCHLLRVRQRSARAMLIWLLVSSVCVTGLPPPPPWPARHCYRLNRLLNPITRLPGPRQRIRQECD